MKLATLADLHAREKDLAEFTAQYQAALEECDARNVDAIVIAGDVYHRPGKAIARNLHRVIDAVKKPLVRWLDSDPKRVAYIIPGNHDYSTASDLPFALSEFDGHPRLFVIREPEVVHLDNHDLSLALLPYIYEADYDSELAQLCLDCNGATHRVLVHHIPFAGLLMNKNYAAPFGEKNAARDSQFVKAFTHVTGGHFHKRQPGYYCGALRQLNFGEEGNPTGFEIWDSETGEAEFVQLNEARKHVTFFCNKSRTAHDVLDHTGRFNIRLIFDGPEPEPEHVRELEAAGVTVEIVRDAYQRESRVENIDASIAADPQAILQLWCENNGIEEDDRTGLIAELMRLEVDRA